MEVQAAVPRELTTDPDVEIVRRMAAGEQEALLQLHRRYRRRVLGYIVKLVRDPALAEEVLQDVWLAAWQGAGRFRGASRVSTWLLGIAHHRSLNAFRQADRRRLEPVAPERLRATEPWEGDEGSAVASGLESAEMRELLAQAMERLSPVHQAALRLVFLHGLSLKEAAAVMGCPVGTVKSRLSHARQRLRECLEAENAPAPAPACATR
ncbi:RNA polymerase sigma factor [Carboxydochorda subterranea]|uniref:RNA polymerase sigma factor n=1 Tax=Carboxydichorda subterranea TaxID=3109565 RepID=A0ABZ1BX92_9FIRM|nr:RNA polymerase sigma factor [Limnochorda sp. L945t]WRP17235.1 RNA polymerase sigma factor [Limnochorda sp. L945t]